MWRVEQVGKDFQLMSEVAYSASLSAVDDFRVYELCSYNWLQFSEAFMPLHFGSSLCFAHGPEDTHRSLKAPSWALYERDDLSSSL